MPMSVRCRGGSTPVTVYIRPSRRSDRPTMAGIAAERVAPEAMAQDHHVAGVVGRVAAAVQHRDAETRRSSCGVVSTA